MIKYETLREFAFSSLLFIFLACIGVRDPFSAFEICFSTQEPIGKEEIDLDFM